MYRVEELKFDCPNWKKLKTEAEYGFLLVFQGVAYVDRQWEIGNGEILICKPEQVLILEHKREKFPLFALWLCIDTNLLKTYSTEQTWIVESFEINSDPIIPVKGHIETLMLIKSLTAQIASLKKEQGRYAFDLLEESSLKMFLALVLRVCILADCNRPKQRSQLVMDKVFHYIHAHLTEDLTLEHLEKHFFVSRHHLIQQFKRLCGMTVHQYIVKARLDLSRNYIEQGYAITSVYRMVGFGSYNHFFRAFKQEYGLTPKAYYRKIHSRKENESK